MAPAINIGAAQASRKVDGVTFSAEKLAGDVDGCLVCDAATNTDELCAHLLGNHVLLAGIKELLIQTVGDAFVAVECLIGYRGPTHVLTGIHHTVARGDGLRNEALLESTLWDCRGAGEMLESGETIFTEGEAMLVCSALNGLLEGGPQETIGLFQDRGDAAIFGLPVGFRSGNGRAKAIESNVLAGGEVLGRGEGDRQQKDKKSFGHS